MLLYLSIDALVVPVLHGFADVLREQFVTVVNLALRVVVLVGAECKVCQHCIRLVGVLGWLYVSQGSLNLFCDVFPVGERSERGLLSDDGFGVEGDEYRQMIRAERSESCPGDPVGDGVGGCRDVR